MVGSQPPKTEGFVVLLHDQPFVEQVRMQLSATQHVFRWTTHLDRLGAAKPTHEAVLIDFDAAGKVRRSTHFSRTGTLHMAEFAEGQAILTLRDGSVQAVAIPHLPDLVLQQNILLQLSLCCARLPRDAGPVVLSYFSPDALAMRSLEATATGEHDWLLSLGLRLVMDSSQRLVGAQKPDDPTALLGRAGDVAFPDEPLESLRNPETPMDRPAPPASVERHEVKVSSDDVTLHGLVVRPVEKAQAAPWAVFQNGSGMISRWGEAPGTRLKTLETMDALALAGVTCVSVDSRGAGDTGFGKADRGLAETRLADLRAVLRWAHQQAGAEAAIFVVAHSLGALIALLHLQQNPSEPLRGLVLLAPPGRPLRAVLLSQNAREAKRLALSMPEADQREAALIRWLDSQSKADTSELRLGGLRPLTDPMILNTDPTTLMSAVRCPVLILHGDKDIQTGTVEDARALFTAAKAGAVTAEFVELADADHLFRHEPGLSTAERYQQDLAPNDQYLATVVDWIVAHATQ